MRDRYLAKCAACHELRNAVELDDGGICRPCVIAGWRPCDHCDTPTQRVGDTTLRCLDGHGHDVCPGCALEWENACPDSDEVRVAKELMA